MKTKRFHIKQKRGLVKSLKAINKYINAYLHILFRIIAMLLLPQCFDY